MEVVLSFFSFSLCMSMIEGRSDRTVVMSILNLWVGVVSLLGYFITHSLFIFTLLSYYVFALVIELCTWWIVVTCVDACVYSMQIARSFMVWGF
jgi:hypothetical protein